MLQSDVLLFIKYVELQEKDTKFVYALLKINNIFSHISKIVEHKLQSVIINDFK